MYHYPEVLALSQWARRFCGQAPVVLGSGVILLLCASGLLIRGRS
jgi:hypothetical protein